MEENNPGAQQPRTHKTQDMSVSLVTDKSYHPT